jgi:hypothetical protein
VLKDAAAVQPVTGIGGSTFFDREMTLLGAEPAFVYDLNGRTRGSHKPGSNDIEGFAPGIYFVRLVTTKRTAKVVVAR